MDWCMNEIIINERISYIEATEEPLSADIGIIRCGDTEWLYDVGNDLRSLDGLDGEYNVVLSHFHQDHTGSLDKVLTGELYVSGETFRHTGRGTVVTGELTIGDLRIFQIPSSHTKGCLGLEVGNEYVLVSHFQGLVRLKDEVIAELEEIYSKREKNNPDIIVGR